MSRSPLAALLAALASIAVLVPPVASADILPPVVVGDVVEIIADEEDDSIVLTVAANGNLAVNGTATALAADDAALIVALSEGGADTIDASALAEGDYAEAFLEGGEGDDVVIGGGGTDQVIGTAGNDLLAGGLGEDGLFGGADDDVMIWNAGDGADLMEGEGGFDQSEINGSPTLRDEIAYTPDATAATGVSVDLGDVDDTQVKLGTTERLTINGLGGRDLLRPEDELETISGRTSLVLNGGGENDEMIGDRGDDVLNGGGGVDRIFGRGGADTLHGGDGNDEMIGEDGDDRLLGDRGIDLMSGAAGDDVLVWSNGDGSDEIEGEAGFDRFEFNGSPGGIGDALSLVVENTVTNLRRTDPTQVEVEFLGVTAGAPEPHAGIEQLTVDGLAGDDTLTVADGLAGLRVTARGGPGDDVLEGSEEEDVFLGGPGEDTIDPGEGSDQIDGQGDDDELFSVDGFADLVRGGEGEDTAQADANVDAVESVEELDLEQPDDPKQPDKPQDPVRPPVADTRALLPQLGKVSVTRKGSMLLARVPLNCPAAEAGGCAATVTLQTAGAVKLGKVKAPLVLGSKATRLAAGQQATATIRLAAGAGELARGGKLKVRLRLDSSDAAGNTATRGSVLNLKVEGVVLRQRSKWLD